MIFATVGTQLPFDRLLSGLDSWAMRNPDVPVLAQAGASTRTFAHIRTVRDLSQSEFRDRLQSARLIVAHAGMGTILSAAEMGKPVIVMPRRSKFNEHRTDHQQDTATEMARLSNVTVVGDGEALHEALDRALATSFAWDARVSSPAGLALAPLIEVIREFVWSETEARPARVMLGRDKVA